VEWLTDGDERQLRVDDEYLLQRYALATFWISTYGKVIEHSEQHRGDGDADGAMWTKRVGLGAVDYFDGRGIIRLDVRDSFLGPDHLDTTTADWIGIAAAAVVSGPEGCLWSLGLKISLVSAVRQC